MVLLLVTITCIAFERMESIQARTRQIAEVGNKRMAVAQSMMNAANDAIVALYGFMLAAEDAEIKIQGEQYERALGRYVNSRKTYESMLSANDTTLTAQIKKLDAAARPSINLNGIVVQAASHGGNVLASFKVTNPLVAQGEWRTEIGKLIEVAPEIRTVG